MSRAPLAPFLVRFALQPSNDTSLEPLECLATYEHFHVMRHVLGARRGVTTALQGRNFTDAWAVATRWQTVGTHGSLECAPLSRACLRVPLINAPHRSCRAASAWSLALFRTK